MANEINSLSGASAPVETGHRAGKARNASAATEGAASSAASAPSDVHITDSANLLSSLAQQLHNMPTVNEARVAQFRTAIESGSYTVRSGQVASQLMQLEHSLAQITGG